MDSPSDSARKAAAGVVAILGGIALPRALFTSLDRAEALWLITSIGIGLVVGASGVSLRKTATRAALPAALQTLSALGYVWVRLLANYMKDPHAPIQVPVASGGLQAATGEVLVALSLFAFTGFIATWILALFAAEAEGPITKALVALFRFGPDGVNRTRKLVASLAGLVVAVYALWAAIG